MIEYSIDYITRIYVGLLVLGGVIVHIATTVDTFKKASEGAFSRGTSQLRFLVKQREM